jgi:hypothetical protein
MYKGNIVIQRNDDVYLGIGYSVSYLFLSPNGAGAGAGAASLQESL